MACAGSIHMIMTSGLILVLITAAVGGIFENSTVTSVVKTISIGSLCATIRILFVLPGVLAACDKIVTKKRDRVSNQAKQAEKIIAILLVVGVSKTLQLFYTTLVSDFTPFG